MLLGPLMLSMAFVMGVGLRLQQLWVYLSAHDNQLVDGHHSFEGLKGTCRLQIQTIVPLSLLCTG